MKEEDAKHKQCPFNGGNCLGRECMLWKVYVPMQVQGEKIGVNQGTCGLKHD